jgi:hypothetical protein
MKCPRCQARTHTGSGSPVDPERAREAARRPIGAYYRIVDSDVGQVQAAVVEGDAVLASRMGSSGVAPCQSRAGASWAPGNPAGPEHHRPACLCDRWVPRGRLHYSELLGPQVGVTWYALLSYDDWLENRQDAWVARSGPETRNAAGEPKIYVGGLRRRVGQRPRRDECQRARRRHRGDSIPREHRGQGGTLGGRVGTRKEDFAGMAERVLLAPALADGHRHVVLYAHGGLNAEGPSAVNAGRLWRLAKEQRLPAYFFIWESGISESILGWLTSDDDARGAGPVQLAGRLGEHQAEDPGRDSTSTTGAWRRPGPRGAVGLLGRDEGTRSRSCDTDGRGGSTPGSK